MRQEPSTGTPLTDAKYMEVRPGPSQTNPRTLWKALLLMSLHAKQQEKLVARTREDVFTMREMAARLCEARDLPHAAKAIRGLFVAFDEPSGVINWTTEGCPEHHGQPWQFNIKTHTVVGRRCPLCFPEEAPA